MKIAEINDILVGMIMTIHWVFLNATKQSSGLQTRPIRVVFHLAAGFISALELVMSGITILVRSTRRMHSSLPFAGMLSYAVIVSQARFAQQEPWFFAALFALLLVLTIACVFVVKRELSKEGKFVYE